VFSTSPSTASVLKDTNVVPDPKAIQREIEDIRGSFSKRFNQLYSKEALIKIVAGLVKEQP
jgi:hypothetical protein